MAKWLKRGAAALGGLLALAVILVLAMVGVAQVTGNFHKVIPGQLYRSAQLTPEQLDRYHRNYGIRTVINLRGENKGSDWYDVEVAQSRRLGMVHLDFRMSSRRGLSEARARELIAMMHSAPGPVLIHCRDGTDRTSLASAIYLAAVAGHGEAAAERQMTIAYGHIPLAVNPAYEMDRSWDKLEVMLGFSDS